MSDLQIKGVTVRENWWKKTHPFRNTGYPPLPRAVGGVLTSCVQVVPSVIDGGMGGKEHVVGRWRIEPERSPGFRILGGDCAENQSGREVWSMVGWGDSAGHCREAKDCDCRHENGHPVLSVQVPKSCGLGQRTCVKRDSEQV